MIRSPRRRLLIVDDEPDIRYLFRTALYPHFDVYEADNGREAVNMAQRTPPDVVLLDLMMPHLNGFDVLATLRQAPATAHSTIVVLTAFHSPQALAKGIALGADLYLTKPVTALNLKQLITTLEDDLDGRVGPLPKRALRPDVLPDQGA